MILNQAERKKSGLKTIQVPTSIGPQTAGFILTKDSNLQTTITNLETSLDKILSSKVFVEHPW